MGRRIRWLGLVMTACFAVVLVQLVNLQFRRGPALASAAGNPRNTVLSYDNARGDILASNGTVLATSVKTRPGQSDVGPYKYYRTYPQGSLYAQMVGYDSFYLGTSGIEYQYNKDLVAHSQPATTLGQLFSPPPPTTDNVTLTVVPSLQKLAQSELAGRDGAVVVLNPTTGAVEAMYSNPTYNPNPLAVPNFNTEKAADFADNVKDSQGFTAFDSLAYHETFAPGSTFKVVTTSAVYNLKPSLENFKTPYVTQTKLPGTNKLFHNYDFEKCGGDIASLLPPSCDTGYALLGIQIGAPTLYQQAKQFGFDTVPPLDIPDVAASSFPTPKQLANDPPGVAYSAIGQLNVSASALQMALVVAGVANGGVIMTPHLMSQIRDSSGKLVQSFQPTPWLRATSQKAAATVTALMRTVVTASNGTGHGVFGPGEDVAAKTGTAETGTTNQLTNDWMVAFAPANDPRVAVAVVVPNQAKLATGNSVAGPIISKMVTAALAATPVPPRTAAGTSGSAGAPKSALSGPGSHLRSALGPGPGSGAAGYRRHSIPTA